MKTILRASALLMVFSFVIIGVLNWNIREVVADPISVTTPNDELDGLSGNGWCSLREAIENANNDDKGQDDCASGAGTNLILLPDFLFTLNRDGARLEDGNQTGDLDITGELTILGVGINETIIQAGTSSPLGGTCADCYDRVFHVLPGAELTLRDLTVRHGQAPVATDSQSAESGGGIKNQGELTLNGVNLTYNHAGNGLEGKTGTLGFGGQGGGIYNLGTLTTISSLITNNHAGSGSDIYLPTGGHGGFGGYGGGIYSGGDSSVFLTGTLVKLNRAGNGGMAADNESGDGGDGGDGGRGGGIYCAYCQLTMWISSLVENYSGTGGDGGDSVGGGGSGGYGGFGGHGGGLYLDGSDTTVSMIACRIHDNEAGGGGYSGESSGINTIGTPNLRGSGGGILIVGDAQLNISGSTVSENYGYSGGGIFTDEGGEVTLYNSTISGNMSDYDGGGINNQGQATIDLTYVTLTGNISDYDYNGGGTGGGFSSTSTLTMTNTIIAGNQDWSGFDNPDCRGSPISMDYNLIGVADSVYCYASPQSNDQFGTVADPIDPLLGSLTNNGGRTQTHALDPSSDAVDKILPGGNGCIPGTTKDQRGIIRFGYCDIGAYEIDTALYIYLPLIRR